MSESCTPYLSIERACLGRLLPGLDAELQKIGFHRLEHTEALGVRVIKAYGGVRLCIPKAYGGIGATATEAVHVQRALAMRAPSATIATVMHHFSVATLAELTQRSSGMEWLLLEAIAKNDLLVASGFAEADPQGKILRPHMVLEPCEKGLCITGVKRPCSLSKSMNLISVSVIAPGKARQDDRLAVALIAADAEGVSTGPFWKNTILAATETGEVRFDKVRVDSKMLSYSGSPDSLDEIQTRGLMWFQLLISAAYLGVATVLVEKVVASQRASYAELARMGIELEGAMVTLTGLAHAIESGNASDHALAQALCARYAVQQAIERATSLAFELLGGLDFARSMDASYLVAAARGLSFHPPSRPKMMDRLGAYLDGQGLHEV
jgi:alkylation response protein AidB-like acyl-CoA dehydrogenase